MWLLYDGQETVKSGFNKNNIKSVESKLKVLYDNA